MTSLPVFFHKALAFQGKILYNINIPIGGMGSKSKGVFEMDIRLTERAVEEFKGLDSKSFRIDIQGYG